MASLVIAMQLRQIFYQIDARLKRHRNYRRIVAVLDQQYVLVFVSAVNLVYTVVVFVAEHALANICLRNLNACGGSGAKMRVVF